MGMRNIAAVVLVFSCSALGGSLPFARNGVFDSPDAYILDHTEVEVELAASAYTVEDSTGASDSEFMLTGHLDVGLFNYGQIGVSYLGDGGVCGSLKIRILQEGIEVPAFAIGLDNISGEEYIEHFKVNNEYYPYAHAQNWSAYGVLSKDLRYIVGLPATASLGIGIGRFVGVIDSGALGIGSSIAHGMFGSVVYYPNEVISVGLEQDGRDLNFGASYDISKHFTLQFAWAELEMAVFPPENQNRQDVMQNSKFSVGLRSQFGPLIGARRMELERERQRIERARQRLQELEDRRRAAEAELQRLRDLLEERD
jgi:hypothetical protein